MPHLSPQTLTEAEQRALLSVLTSLLRRLPVRSLYPPPCTDLCQHRETGSRAVPTNLPS